MPNHKKDGISSGLVGFVVLVCLFMAYLWAKEQGYLTHEDLTTVYSDGWAAGEYKECSSINTGPNNLQLECGSGGREGTMGKVFKVEFYGQTYAEDQPSRTIFNWSCRKNGNDDPTFTCRRPEVSEPRANQPAVNQPEVNQPEVSPPVIPESPEDKQKAQMYVNETSCIYRFEEKGIHTVDGKPIETACKENPLREAPKNTQ